jgi:microcystin-dependent protein
MSQHDFDLANQSAPEFRADANAAFQALASCSSGATAPATTYAYQLWADTANALLKQRNSANSAWVALFPLAQVVMPAGSMIDFGGTAAPSGWLLCDGSAVSRATYATLFDAIGTTWGAGDGSTTFNVPNLARRVTVGSGGASSGTLGNAVGNTGGAETHTLSTGEIPAHSHGVTDPGHTHTLTQSALVANTAGTAFDNAGTAGAGASVSANSNTTGISIQNAGGGGAHNNMQPSAVVMKIIKI